MDNMNNIEEEKKVTLQARLERDVYEKLWVMKGSHRTWEEFFKDITCKNVEAEK